MAVDENRDGTTQEKLHLDQSVRLAVRSRLYSYCEKKKMRGGFLFPVRIENDDKKMIAVIAVLALLKLADGYTVMINGMPGPMAVAR